MRYALTWQEATLRTARDLTPDIREIEIVPAGGVRPYAPGSHINIALLIDGQPDHRSYSLVGRSGGDCYRIAVRRQPDSRGGSARMHALQPGARLEISDPHNLFELTLGQSEYLLVAGGIGITPLIGMAETLLARAANFRFLYAGRSRAEMAFLDRLQGLLGDRLTICASDEGSRLDIGREISRLSPQAELYLCGPLRLVDAFRAAWAQAGRHPAGLRIETFGSSGAFAPEPFTVKIPELDLSVTVPENRSMLEALAQAGVEVISDCRRGECGLCALDVLGIEGALDHRDVFFSDEEKHQGAKICACVSRARGAVTVSCGYRPDQNIRPFQSSAAA